MKPALFAAALACCALAASCQCGSPLPWSDGGGSDAGLIDSGSDGGAGQDAGASDAGVACGTSSCSPNQLCCAVTQVCYDPGCARCCPVGLDAGCNLTGCDAGACCAFTGRCYNPGCLSCCM